MTGAGHGETIRPPGAGPGPVLVGVPGEAAGVAQADSGAPDDMIVRCDNLVQIYSMAGQQVTALRGVDLTVKAGETLALLGPSGAGKSTLLWLLAGLLRPTAGLVEVCGARVADLKPAAATNMRLREVGIVLQNPGRNLLPYETAAGNVLFAQAPTRRTRAVKRRRTTALLEAVGLAHVASRPAGLLSGGEQQRLAVAVAVANGPRLLLADEPTSQLDSGSAGAVIELLRAANEDLGTTVIVVTHDQQVGQAFGRTVTIRDGKVGAVGHAGEDYLVIARDGSVQLPPDLLDVLPPGTLARAVRIGDGVELRRADVERGAAGGGI
jgi:putative ABC transport system ATP-binding protein